MRPARFWYIARMASVSVGDTASSTTRLVLLHTIGSRRSSGVREAFSGCAGGACSLARGRTATVLSTSMAPALTDP